MTSKDELQMARWEAERKKLMGEDTKPVLKHTDTEPVLDYTDPWIHRSERMKCITCMYYVPKSAGGEGGQPGLGRCRRHSPTMSGFPVMFPTDWCGDHKLDENK